MADKKIKLEEINNNFSTAIMINEFVKKNGSDVISSCEEICSILKHFTKKTTESSTSILRVLETGVANLYSRKSRSTLGCDHLRISFYGEFIVTRFQKSNGNTSVTKYFKVNGR